MNAASIVARLIDAADQLPPWPASGHVVPEWLREEVREVAVYPFRLICRLTPDAIVIMAVIHGSRELPGEVRRRK